jgi:hypothetical protein
VASASRTLTLEDLPAADALGALLSSRGSAIHRPSWPNGETTMNTNTNPKTPSFKTIDREIRTLTAEMQRSSKRAAISDPFT